MDELVERLMTTADLDRPHAEKAIGIILDFLVKEGPADKVQQLMEGMPGSERLLRAAQEEPAGGMLGGMGGLMGAANRLMGAGLSMGQVQTVTREFIAFSREKAGEDAVGEVVGAIPGLGAFA